MNSCSETADLLQNSIANESLSNLDERLNTIYFFVSQINQLIEWDFQVKFFPENPIFSN